MTTFKQQFVSAHREYSDALLRYCSFKVSSPELAKDLLQETFFRAWRYMNTGKSIDNIKAFLYKILGNLIIDEYRSRTADESLERMSEDGFDPGFDDTDRWIDTIDGRDVTKMLGGIREPYRGMLYMRYIEGFTIHEIAKACKASENAVSVRIHRGLRILHDVFSREEGEKS